MQSKIQKEDRPRSLVVKRAGVHEVGPGPDGGIRLLNLWLNHLEEPVANRGLWERLLEATKHHQEVRWRKVKGHSKTAGPHKSGNDRADELAVAAKKEVNGERRTLR